MFVFIMIHGVTRNTKKQRNIGIEIVCTNFVLKRIYSMQIIGVHALLQFLPNYALHILKEPLG